MFCDKVVIIGEEPPMINPADFLSLLDWLRSDQSVWITSEDWSAAESECGTQKIVSIEDK